MVGGDTAFGYKQGNSVLHRCPAWIKLLCLPVLNLCLFALPLQVALACIAVQLAAAALLRFTLRELLRDVAPVLWYAVFLYAAQGVGAFCAALAESGWRLAAAESALRAARDGIIANTASAALFLRLLAAVQCAGLLFRTSSALQLRGGIEIIERAVRRVLPFARKEARFAALLALFAGFIPAVFRLWQQSRRAWSARGGRQGIAMLSALLPVVFSAGMKYAHSVSRAVEARSGP